MVGQVFIDPFKTAGRNGDSSRAHELKHTVQGFQLLVKRGNVIAHARHLDNGKDRIHFHNVGAVTADHLRSLGISLEFRVETLYMAISRKKISSSEK